VAVGFLPVLLLRLGGSLMNGWMWRPTEAEAIYNGACRSKGVANQHENDLSQPSWALFGPIRPRFAPRRF
jgi:hypothetical protein